MKGDTLTLLRRLWHAPDHRRRLEATAGTAAFSDFARAMVEHGLFVATGGFEALVGVRCLPARPPACLLVISPLPLAHPTPPSSPRLHHVLILRPFSLPVPLRRPGTCRLDCASSVRPSFRSLPLPHDSDVHFPCRGHSHVWRTL